MKKTTLCQLIAMSVGLLPTFISNAQSFQNRATGFPIVNTQSTMISIANDDVIWTAPGNSPGVSISTDKGNTWTVHPTPMPTSVTELAATSATTGYVTVFGTIAGIYKSVDSGISWNLQPSTIDGNSFPHTVYFFDVNNGVVIGDPDELGYMEIYTTTNAGSTWSRVSAANLPAAIAGEYGVSTRFDSVGDAIWFTTSGPTPRLFRSLDKGFTWTAAALTGMVTSGQVAEISFSSSAKGILSIKNTSDELKFYGTNDGGVTFAPINHIGLPTSTNSSYWAEYIPGTNTIITSSQSTNTSFISNNDGISWTALGTGLGRTKFRNRDTGFSTSGTISPVEGGIGKWINTISIIGANIGTPWTTDVDMTTSDGINYSLLNYMLPAGEVKFRQNHEWSPSSLDWGSTTFPTGTAVAGPTSIPATAGTYYIYFNKITGEYNFSTTLRTSNFAQSEFHIYPVPVSSVLKIDSNLDIVSFSVFDMTGKSLLTFHNTNEADVSGLAAGMYIISIQSNGGNTSQKFIKQ